MNRVDSKDGGSEKRFHIPVTWCYLSTRQHEQYGDASMHRNVDDVVSVRRQTSHVVVDSVETQNDAIMVRICV